MRLDVDHLVFWRQMEKWSINEVCDFLSENDFEEDIVECFRVNKIRGRVLFLLSEDDMKQLGLDALGDRKYFQHILHNKRDKEKAENMKKEDAIVESSTSTHPSKSLRSDVTARDQVKRTPDTTGSHSSFWQPDDVGTSATVGNTTMEFDRAADEEDSDYDFMLDSQDFSDEDDNTENTPSGSAGANNIADRSSSISLGSQKPLADTENRAPLVAFLEKHQPLSISLESLPFHDSVITSLKERRLVGRTRSKFVTEIAKAMIRLKNYPGKKDYDRVARQIVSKWKFLGEQVGHDFLVEALRNRMKNLRQMVQHKNDPFHRRRLSTKTRPVKPSHQMPTPPPLAIPLRKEDRPRHDGYVSELLRECKCVPPIKQKVESLMHATFPFRRYDILENVLSFDELLLTYPPLKDPAELGREFNRVMRCDVVSHIRTTWKALCAKIIAVGKQEAVENYHIFKLLSNLPSDMPEGDLQVLALCVLYYMIPDICCKVNAARIVSWIKEDDNVQLVLTQLPTAQPCVIMKGTLLEGIKEASLVVQNHIITTFEPKNIVTVLMSAYYAYNKHYPDGCSHLYTTLEVLLLNQKKPSMKTRITALLNRLTYNSDPLASL